MWCGKSIIGIPWLSLLWYSVDKIPCRLGSLRYLVYLTTPESRCPIPAILNHHLTQHWHMSLRLVSECDTVYCHYSLEKISNPVQHKVRSSRCFFSLLQTCWGGFCVPFLLLYSMLGHNGLYNHKEGIPVNYLSETKLENKRKGIVLRSNNRMLCYLAQI